MTDELKEVEPLDEAAQLKAIEKLIRGDDDDVIFESYVKPNRFGSKFWLNTTLVVLFIVFAALFKFLVVDNIIPAAVVVSSLEVTSIDSKWVVKEKVKEKDFEGVIMVPQISLRFRNVGDIDLKYVSILSIFKVSNRSRSLGDTSRMIFDKALKPGDESDVIVLTSNYGYKTSSNKAFSANSKEWKDTVADIFVKCGSSSYEPYKKFFMSHKVEGVDRQVGIKFK